MPILTQSANLKDNVLIELAQWTAEQVDIANVVARNNRSLSAGDGKYTNPVDNKESFGQLKSPDKAGYGTKLIVQEDTKRDNIIRNVWNALSPKQDEIIKHYKETLQENEIKADVLDFEYTRDTSITSGALCIKLNIQFYRADDTPLGKVTRGFLIYAKGLRQTKGDPHELMAGILIAMQKKINVRGINAKTLVKRNDELDKLCEEIYDHRADVDGYKQKEADLIEGDIVNLAKAISISNYVNNLLIRNNAKKVKVYQTGASWAKSISKFKGSDKSKDSIIKSYNSSDLIVKFNLKDATHHWGLSLKKKGFANNESDPTLLNKPVVGEGKGKQTAGFLNLKGTQKQKGELLKKENRFFKAVYYTRFGESPDLRTNWKKRLNDGLADNEKKAALTGRRGTLRETRDKVYPRNIFFEEIDQVFRDIMKEPKNFKDFLDLCFRIDIDDYVNQENFHFSLITGIGGLDAQGKLVAQKADEKSSAFIKQIFTYMFQGGKIAKAKGGSLADFSKNNFKLETTRNKIQAFDQQRNAMVPKLFYTLFISSLELVNIEVRYKGTITANPQFQVFITRRFSKFLTNAKREMGAMGIHAYLR